MHHKKAFSFMNPNLQKRGKRQQFSFNLIHTTKQNNYTLCQAHSRNKKGGFDVGPFFFPSLLLGLHLTLQLIKVLPM